MRDIAKATLIRQRITTTIAIAKEGRKVVDRLITMGKKGTLLEKRKAFALLCDHQLVSELFENIAPRFKTRQGGYTRIIQMNNRRGDNASMVLLELTEKSEAPLNKPKVEKAPKSKVVDVEAQAEGHDEKEVKKQPKKHVPPTEDKGKKKPQGSIIKKMFQRKVGGE
jgi:large subunit ribosomal protein L17